MDEVITLPSFQASTFDVGDVVGKLTAGLIVAEKEKGARSASALGAVSER